MATPSQQLVLEFNKNKDNREEVRREIEDQISSQVSEALCTY